MTRTPHMDLSRLNGIEGVCEENRKRKKNPTAYCVNAYCQEKREGKQKKHFFFPPVKGCCYGKRKHR
jgi:hypothetical protein